MANRGLRLLALSVVILTGGLMFSISPIATAANPNYGRDSQVVGILLILLSGVAFVIEYIKTAGDPPA